MHMFRRSVSPLPLTDRSSRPTSVVQPKPEDVTMEDGTHQTLEVPTHRDTTPDNEHRAHASLIIQCSLSIAEVAAELAPVPYIGPLVKCLTAVFQAVEGSRTNKEQWKLLKGRCVMVLRIAGAEVMNNGRQSYPHINEAAQMLEETLKKIRDQIQEYNQMNEIKALLKHQIISEEIKGLFEDLDACLRMFSFASEVTHAQWFADFQAVQEQEKRAIEQVNNELTKIVGSLHEIGQREDRMLDILQALEGLLRDKSSVIQDQGKTTVNDYVDAQQIVRTILSATNLRLPPQLLLGRQCILETTVPAKTGLTCDIYLASFLGGEKVAKKVFRLGTSEKEDVEKYAKRFLRIAELWFDFRSHYTLMFHGIGMEPLESPGHFQLYMVSPLMKNFDAVAYLKQYRKNPGMKKNILRIASPITDAARGLKYLHHDRDPPVIHSGMRGDNILITDSGGAVLGGFGLTKALEKDDSGLPPAVMTGKSESQRWMAPEMFEEDYPLATPCDVWGWQIISGSVPYHKHKQVMTVVFKVAEGPPKRKDHPEFDTYAYRPEEMWNLLLKCWQVKPEKRPDINEVIEELEEIAKMQELVV